MTRLLAGLRAFYVTQLHLWERHGQRYDLSGLDARADLHRARPELLEPLHWAGPQLRGDVLPPGPPTQGCGA